MRRLRYKSNAARAGRVRTAQAVRYFSGVAVAATLSRALAVSTGKPFR